MKKVFIYLMLCTMLATLLTGCGGAQQAAATTAQAAQTTQAAQQSQTTTQAEQTTAAAAEQTTAQPASSGVKLTYWVVANADMLITTASINDTPFAKAWLEAVGIDVEFQQPPAGQESEQFNLMVASQSLPDIIEYNINGNYPGGASAAIEDQIIIKLNDAFDSGWAPNLMKVYDERPEYFRLAKLDDGELFCFPFMRFDDVLSTYNGPVLRKDYLEKVGKEPPQTIDEWTDVLRAFKEAGVEYPISVMNGSLTNTFVSAYGTVNDYYVKDGVVTYGPIEPGFKEFLTLFNSWIKEGLLDEEFISQDRKLFDSKVTSGQAGAYTGTPDSWIGTFMRIMTEEDPTVDMVGVQYPRLNRTDPKVYTQKDIVLMVNSNGAAHITSSCKEVETACKLLDYFFSDEGLLLSNFGIEGESYTMVDGEPTFTEYITKNPDGLTMKQAMAQYAFCGLGNFHGVQLKSPVWQQRFFPVQNQSIEAWMSGGVFDWPVPPVTIPVDDSVEYGRIRNDINTYKNENYSKFIMGDRSLDEFDSYVNDIQNMDLQRVLDILQAGYERFMAR